MQLYREGHNDREISEALGLTNPSHICDWRKSQGLPPNYARRFDEERAMAAYLAGMTNAEIALPMGVKAITVRQWRVRNGLLMNKPGGITQ